MHPTVAMVLEGARQYFPANHIAGYANQVEIFSRRTLVAFAQIQQAADGAVHLDCMKVVARSGTTVVTTFPPGCSVTSTARLSSVMKPASLMHTHPTPTGPSDADRDMLARIGQERSGLYEAGTLCTFKRKKT